MHYSSAFSLSAPFGNARKKGGIAVPGSIKRRQLLMLESRNASAHHGLSSFTEGLVANLGFNDPQDLNRKQFLRKSIHKTEVKSLSTVEMEPEELLVAENAYKSQRKFEREKNLKGAFRNRPESYKERALNMDFTEHEFSDIEEKGLVEYFASNEFPVTVNDKSNESLEDLLIKNNAEKRFMQELAEDAAIRLMDTNAYESTEKGQLLLVQDVSAILNYGERYSKSKEWENLQKRLVEQDSVPESTVRRIIHLVDHASLRDRRYALLILLNLSSVSTSNMNHRKKRPNLVFDFTSEKEERKREKDEKKEENEEKDKNEDKEEEEEEEEGSLLLAINRMVNTIKEISEGWFIDDRVKKTFHRSLDVLAKEKGNRVASIFAEKMKDEKISMSPLTPTRILNSLYPDIAKKVPERKVVKRMVDRAYLMELLSPMFGEDWVTLEAKIRKDRGKKLLESVRQVLAKLDNSEKRKDFDDLHDELFVAIEDYNRLLKHSDFYELKKGDIEGDVGFLFTSAPLRKKKMTWDAFVRRGATTGYGPIWSDFKQTFNVNQLDMEKPEFEDEEDEKTKTEGKEALDVAVNILDTLEALDEEEKKIYITKANFADNWVDSTNLANALASLEKSPSNMKLYLTALDDKNVDLDVGESIYKHLQLQMLKEQAYFVTQSKEEKELEHKIKLVEYYFTNLLAEKDKKTKTEVITKIVNGMHKFFAEADKPNPWEDFNVLDGKFMVTGFIEDYEKLEEYSKTMQAAKLEFEFAIRYIREMSDKGSERLKAFAPKKSSKNSVKADRDYDLKFEKVFDHNENLRRFLKERTGAITLVAKEAENEPKDKEEIASLTPAAVEVVTEEPEPQMEKPRKITTNLEDDEMKEYQKISDLVNSLSNFESTGNTLNNKLFEISTDYSFGYGPKMSEEILDAVSKLPSETVRKIKTHLKDKNYWDLGVYAKRKTVLLDEVFQKSFEKLKAEDKMVQELKLAEEQKRKNQALKSETKEPTANVDNGSSYWLNKVNREQKRALDVVIKLPFVIKNPETTDIRIMRQLLEVNEAYRDMTDTPEYARTTYPPEFFKPQLEELVKEISNLPSDSIGKIKTVLENDVIWENKGISFISIRDNLLNKIFSKRIEAYDKELSEKESEEQDEKHLTEMKAQLDLLKLPKGNRSEEDDLKSLDIVGREAKNLVYRLHGYKYIIKTDASDMSEFAKKKVFELISSMTPAELDKISMLLTEKESFWEDPAYNIQKFGPNNWRTTTRSLLLEGVFSKAFEKRKKAREAEEMKEPPASKENTLGVKSSEINRTKEEFYKNLTLLKEYGDAQRNDDLARILDVLVSIYESMSESERSDPELLKKIEGVPKETMKQINRVLFSGFGADNGTSRVSILRKMFSTNEHKNVPPRGYENSVVMPLADDKPTKWDTKNAKKKSASLTSAKFTKQDIEEAEDVLFPLVEALTNTLAVKDVRPHDIRERVEILSALCEKYTSNLLSELVKTSEKLKKEVNKIKLGKMILLYEAAIQSEEYFDTMSVAMEELLLPLYEDKTLLVETYESKNRESYEKYVLDQAVRRASSPGRKVDSLLDADGTMALRVDSKSRYQTRPNRESQGIPNNGNDCFMSSTLQNLIQLRPFWELLELHGSRIHNAILENRDKYKRLTTTLEKQRILGKVYKELQNSLTYQLWIFFTNMRERGVTLSEMKNFRLSPERPDRWVVAAGPGGRKEDLRSGQHDPDEFFRRLKYLLEREGMQVKKRFELMHAVMYHRYYEGDNGEESYNECPSCGIVYSPTVVYEVMDNMSFTPHLNVPEQSLISMINEDVGMYFLDEHDYRKCEGTLKTGKPCTRVWRQLKATALTDLPEILEISFNLFGTDLDQEKVVHHVNIEFPELLDFSKEPLFKQGWMEFDHHFLKYELRGIECNVGALEAVFESRGHYIAYVKELAAEKEESEVGNNNSKNLWREKNDKNTRSVSFSDITKILMKGPTDETRNYHTKALYYVNTEYERLRSLKINKGRKMVASNLPREKEENHPGSITSRNFSKPTTNHRSFRRETKNKLELHGRIDYDDTNVEAFHGNGGGDGTPGWEDWGDWETDPFDHVGSGMNNATSTTTITTTYELPEETYEPPSDFYIDDGGSNDFYESMLNPDQFSYKPQRELL